ncbi:GIY-YIG nuclease family protein [Actinotignum timonense]|uniref:GIY-YIG nuclease family protein n=1 Tax=Actinotignum timonense TaxID=1870995 RepID=UPI00254E157C|nr:GIY-YIG nuclease family protein [Actinotignum timonense]MDK8781929.1 GIY-YIG nuclease family protein [Actinotignum timonense]
MADFDFEAEFAKILASDTEGLLDAPPAPRRFTSEDRLERAFLEIVDFRAKEGREPDPHTRSIGERKLGARLEGIRADPEKLEKLKDLDTEFGLLTREKAPQSIDDVLASDEFNLLDDGYGITDVSRLPAAPPRTNTAPDYVAKRVKAKEFEKFEPLFKAKHAQLSAGVVEQKPYKSIETGINVIRDGLYFVLNGVMGYVDSEGEDEKTVTSAGKTITRQRLRVIFENGTESDLYRQSLAGRMAEEDGRIITQPADVAYDLAYAEPTAGGEASSEITSEASPDETPTGWIYVLRSLSTDPQVSSLRNLHKIGFSRGPVEKRIAGAEQSPTYLMAPVEIVDTYVTYDVNAAKLEHLLHQIFADVKVSLSQIDSEGKNYDPSEWFIVPREAIATAVELIQNGENTRYRYDKGSESFLEIKNG